MHRHVIAPARFFSQVPNEIIRHPRLSSDAVRLLTWQLSLPRDADEPLSKTASRARLGRTAFQNAKYELLAEGYLHEWRRQSADGRWQTHQLISSVPLSPDEARAAQPAKHENARSAPSAAAPAAGEPTGRSVGRQPLFNTEQNTSHQPPAPAPAPAGGEHATAAEQLLLDLRRADPRLAMPVRTARSWAPLAAAWMARGHSPDEVHRILTLGLDTVRSPLGVLRWRLEHALPATAVPTSTPPTPTVPPRVARMRECRGAHTQPRLFMPEADEDHCRACHSTQRPPAATPPAGAPGFATYLTTRATLHPHRAA